MACPSEEAILEFQKIFKKEYGVEYSHKEASEAAYNLMNFFELLIKVEVENRKKENRK